MLSKVNCIVTVDDVTEQKVFQGHCNKVMVKSSSKTLNLSSLVATDPFEGFGVEILQFSAFFSSQHSEPNNSIGFIIALQRCTFAVMVSDWWMYILKRKKH